MLIFETCLPAGRLSFLLRPEVSGQVLWWQKSSVSKLIDFGERAKAQETLRATVNEGKEKDV